MQQDVEEAHQEVQLPAPIATRANGRDSLPRLRCDGWSCGRSSAGRISYILTLDLHMVRIDASYFCL